MDARWRRLTVLGILTFLVERLEQEVNREALAYISYMGAIADDDRLDGEDCVVNLQRAWYAKSALRDASLLRRDTYEQRIVEGAPLEAALDKIGEVLKPPKPPGGSVFGRVSRA